VIVLWSLISDATMYKDHASGELRLPVTVSTEDSIIKIVIRVTNRRMG
jgi:hypothetical protein